MNEMEHSQNTNDFMRLYGFYMRHINIQNEPLVVGAANYALAACLADIVYQQNQIGVFLLLLRFFVLCKNIRTGLCNLC